MNTNNPQSLSCPDLADAANPACSHLLLFAFFLFSVLPSPTFLSFPFLLYIFLLNMLSNLHICLPFRHLPWSCSSPSWNNLPQISQGFTALSSPCLYSNASFSMKTSLDTLFITGAKTVSPFSASFFSISLFIPEVRGIFSLLNF